MPGPSDKPKPRIDRSRRLALRRLGLAATAAYLSPALLALSGARASDSVSFSAGSFSAPSFSAPSSSTQAAPQRPRAVPRAELVVLAPPGTDFSMLAASGYELLDLEALGLIEADLGRLLAPAGMGVEAARDMLLSLLPGALIAPNDLYRPSELPCRGGECAAFELVGWRQDATCAAAPRIGMIDGGVNPDHAALAGQSLEVVPLSAAGRQPSGRTHGTAIAALLIGSEDSPAPGLLPRAELLAIEAFHSDAAGEAVDAFGVVAGLDRLAAREVSVINMSFAGPPNEVLTQALQAAADRGIGLVAAAGNDGPRAEPRFPAADPEVVAVTAVDHQLRVYRQAGAGAHIALAAPGVGVWTAASISGGRFRSGTSYAAPFVTAALALARHEDPQAPVGRLVERLASAARDLGAPGHDEVYGWGLVQANGDCAL